MPDRVQLGREKTRCALTFKVFIEVPLSISMTEKEADNFKWVAGNMNQDSAKVLRDLLFTELGIAKSTELMKLFEKPINDARKVIYTKLKVNEDKSFSIVMHEQITKYVEKNK